MLSWAYEVKATFIWVTQPHSVHSAVACSLCFQKHTNNLQD